MKLTAHERGKKWCTEHSQYAHKCTECYPKTNTAEPSPVSVEDSATGITTGLTIAVQVREELFHFISERDWINAAQMRFRNHGHTSQSVIAVDANGLICTRGKMFKIAVYPVRVYAIDDAPYQVAAMRGPRRETGDNPDGE